MKKNGTKTKTNFVGLLKSSFIVGWLITLADYLYAAIPKSAIVRFFAGYPKVGQKFEQGLIGGSISRLKLPRPKALAFKMSLSRLTDNSLFSRLLQTLKMKLLTARLRVYGAALFAYGLASGGLCLVQVFAYGQGLVFVNAALAAGCLLCGAVFVFSKKPLGQALYDGLCTGCILQYFVGVRRSEMVYDVQNDRGITLGFFTGLVLGAISFRLSPIYIFGAIAALVLLWVVGSKPEFGITLSIFALPFLPTMAMCGLTLYCAAVFAFKVLRGKRTFRFEAVDFAVALFMVFILFGGAVSADASSSLKSAAVFLALMLNYFLFANLVRNDIMTGRVLGALACSMFFTSLIGLYQKFFMEANTTWHDTSMFEDIGTRIYSTFQNPNVYGEYLVMAIPLALALLFVHKGAKKRIPVFIMMASALLALVYTQSRGAWLAFIISIAIYLLVRTGRMLVVYLLGLFSLPVLPFILPESIVSRFMSIGNLGDSSTSYRVSIWQAAVNMIKDFFAGGIGIGTSAFSKVYPSYSLAGIEAAPHSHQLFFQISIEMGIFALVAFLAVILLMASKNAHCLMTYGKDNNGYMLVSCAALCGVVGMLIQGMTDYVWYNYRVFGMFWIVAGMCVAAARCAESEPTSSERNMQP